MDLLGLYQAHSMPAQEIASLTLFTLAVPLKAKGIFVSESWSRRLGALFAFKSPHRASLVAQWLRICLPMQGTRVWALVREDPTCRGATRPVSHNNWACASGACAPQQERPRQWEASAPRWRVAPTCHNYRKPSHRNEDPTQPKINK